MGTNDSQGHTQNIRLKMTFTGEYYAATKNYTYEAYNSRRVYLCCKINSKTVVLNLGQFYNI